MNSTPAAGPLLPSSSSASWISQPDLWLPPGINGEPEPVLGVDDVSRYFAGLAARYPVDEAVFASYDPARPVSSFAAPRTRPMPRPARGFVWWLLGYDPDYWYTRRGLGWWLLGYDPFFWYRRRGFLWWLVGYDPDYWMRWWYPYFDELMVPGIPYDQYQMGVADPAMMGMGYGGAAPVYGGAPPPLPSVSGLDKATVQILILLLIGLLIVLASKSAVLANCCAVQLICCCCCFLGSGMGF